MPIKFKCPHCQKALAVKDHLAGKRAACPACKKVLTIPAPTAAPADVEDFAASALTDQPAAAAEAKKAAATIDFTCEYCDAELHLPADLGGKRAPCPECRRILKVPLPAKTDPTDWRAIQHRGPTGARQNVEQPPPPEGAWSTAARGTVSREALEEAGAIPEVDEPVTVRTWIRRGVLATAVLAVLIVGWIFLKKLWTHDLEQEALAKALAPVEEKGSKVPPEWAGEVYRAAGELHLRANRLDKAVKAFNQARGQVPGTGTSYDQDAFLIELALSQLDLGGTPEQIDKEQRRSWSEAAGEAQKTLARINPGNLEARHEGVRRVRLKLIAQGQAAYVAGINNPEDVAQEPGQRKKPRLTALLQALLQPDEAKKLFPAPTEDPAQPDLATRALHQSGWMQGHQLAQVRQFLVSKAREDSPVERLECLLTLAAVALHQDQAPEAKQCIKDAVGLLGAARQAGDVSPWLVSDLALLAVRAQSDQIGPLLKILEKHPELAGRVHLEQYRLRAEGADLPADSWTKDVPEKTLAQARALEIYARQRARQGADILSAIGELSPETIRPLGYVGVALGIQDRNK